MKIAIISDIHNNTANLKKVLRYCGKNKIKTIICCGDLASLETLEFLNDNYKGIAYYTFGNMDNDQLVQTNALVFEHVSIYPEFGDINVDNKRIAFAHFPNDAEELAETRKYDFVFYGHTHKPWMDKINNCIILNPGNVAGEIYPPTFAVWETGDDKFELIRIQNLK
jgi:uncharacterized protein